MEVHKLNCGVPLEGMIEDDLCSIIGIIRSVKLPILGYNHLYCTVLYSTYTE